MLRRTALRLAVAALATLLAGGCLSPTLPLPPPDEPDTIQPSTEDPGAWEVSGDCYPGALVTLLNDRTRTGVVVEDTDGNGRYHIEIEADLCDLIQLSQQVVTEGSGVEQSAAGSFVIEERSPGGMSGGACQ